MKKWWLLRLVELTVSSAIAWGLLSLGGGTPPRPPAKVPSKPYRPPEYAAREVTPVPCMDKRPEVLWPTWPAPDRLGTVVMHASTVDKVQEGIITLQAYIDEQYRKCARAAVEGFEPSDVPQ
jgi:hypothetical protein